MNKIITILQPTNNRNYKTVKYISDYLIIPTVIIPKAENWLHFNSSKKIITISYKSKPKYDNATIILLISVHKFCRGKKLLSKCYFDYNALIMNFYFITSHLMHLFVSFRDLGGLTQFWR